MSDAQNPVLQPRFAGLFKAMLCIAGVYYVLFAGLGFGGNDDLQQFLDDAAKRPVADATDAAHQSG